MRRVHWIVLYEMYHFVFSDSLSRVKAPEMVQAASGASQQGPSTETVVVVVSDAPMWLGRAKK